MAAQPLAIQNAEIQPPASAGAKKPIYYWADLIRVLAIYLVVVIHVSGQLTNAWGQVPALQWIMADILGGIARVGVPLFFMLSGFLLLPRSESLRDFYSKRMLRIVIPFIFWSVFYISLDCIGHPGMCTRQYLLPYVLLQRSYFHLWFLYSLIAIYFIIPLLRLLVRPGTDLTFLWYLIALWLIFQPIRTLMDQFLHFSVNINAQLTTGFLPYFILGYLLGNLAVTRGRVAAAGVVFVIGLLVTIVGTYLLTRASGKFNGYFYDYITIGVILSTGAAFVLLRAASDVGFLASERFHSLMRWVAGGTFGVYLIHVLFIWGLDRLGINSFMGFALWSVLLVATLVFVMSFLVVRALQKIPIMNYILPG